MSGFIRHGAGNRGQQAYGIGVLIGSGFWGDEFTGGEARTMYAAAERLHDTELEALKVGVEDGAREMGVDEGREWGFTNDGRRP